MTRVGLEQASASLGELLARAASGERILITDRDRPLGMLSAAPLDEASPAVGTPEWDRMNARRAELLRKKHGAGLTPAEETECEDLQRICREALQEKFPASTQWDKELAQILVRLNGPSSPDNG